MKSYKSMIDEGEADDFSAKPMKMEEGHGGLGEEEEGTLALVSSYVVQHPPLPQLYFDDVMINLKIISKVRPGDKLSIQGNFFNIQSSVMYRLFYQLYYRFQNNRYTTLNHLNDIYEFVFRMIDDSIADVESNHPSNKHRLLRLMNEMVKSGEGLNNLKTSYQGDIATQARLDYLLDQIDIKSQQCMNLLQKKGC